MNWPPAGLTIPSGTLKVTEIDRNPAYHFKAVHSRKPFTIRPGPNNSVGSMWINPSLRDPRHAIPGKSFQVGIARLRPRPVCEAIRPLELAQKAST